MQVFTARVRHGVIVPEDGVTLPEGSKVTVVVDGEHQAFEATAEEESELLEAIAGVDRGETAQAEDLLGRLRREDPTPRRE
jgi:predicted DNA-binding antitoxin AbrB/MazE fold protein